MHNSACRFSLAAATILVAAGLAATAPPSANSVPNAGPPAGNNGPCPPRNFGNLTSLSLTAYIVAPWYIQKQIPLDYSPLDEAYCVRAEYVPFDPRNISAGVVVNNYANRGGVNGLVVGSSKYDSSSRQSRLIAQLANPKARGRDGKLLVGPEILTRLLPGDAWRAAFGPYWIVAVGYSQNTTLKYEWAIVSGGAPGIAGPNGTACTSVPYRNSTAVAAAPAGAGAPRGAGGPADAPYRPEVFERGGLWFFTRKPVDPVNTARMEARAKALGLDTSQMVPVQQAGCLYQS